MTGKIEHWEESLQSMNLISSRSCHFKSPDGIKYQGCLCILIIYNILMNKRLNDCK